jgi:hypothetical protein
MEERMPGATIRNLQSETALEQTPSVAGPSSTQLPAASQFVDLCFSPI